MFEEPAALCNPHLLPGTASSQLSTSCAAQCRLPQPSVTRQGDEVVVEFWVPQALDVAGALHELRRQLRSPSFRGLQESMAGSAVSEVGGARGKQGFFFVCSQQHSCRAEVVMQTLRQACMGREGGLCAAGGGDAPWVGGRGGQLGLRHAAWEVG